MTTRHKTPYGKIRFYSPASNVGCERILIIPGYGESLTHTKKLVDVLNDKGYEAFTYTQPRKRRGELKATDVLTRQGGVVLKVLHLIGENSPAIHAVAHSMGCAAVLYAALAQPDRFESITLMQPLGMVGEQSFRELLMRIGKKISRNTTGAVRGRHVSHAIQDGTYTPLDSDSRLRYSKRVAGLQLAGAGILAKNLRLALHEAKAAGKYDISEAIIKVTQAGIPVHVVTAHSDEMFDRHMVAAGLEIISDHITTHQALSDISAVHDTFWLHPERSAYLIENIIKRPQI